MGVRRNLDVRKIIRQLHSVLIESGQPLVPVFLTLLGIQPVSISHTAIGIYHHYQTPGYLEERGDDIAGRDLPL